MSITVPNLEKLSDIVLKEPLSSETETKRRNLLFASCFSILLAVYGLKVTKTPWLDFEIPNGAPNILHGALSAALVYTFIVFTLHAGADLRRWFLAGDLMHLHNYYDQLLKVREHLGNVSHFLNKPSAEWQNKKEAVERMYTEAGSFLSSLDTALTTAIASHRKLTALQWVRLVIIDLGVPLGLGIFAMFKIGSALAPFLAVVFM